MQNQKTSPIIRTVTSTAFEENAYLVALPGGPDCLVVDPGLEPDRIIDELDRLGWTPAAILNTHGHADHIAGNAAMKARWPECPLIIGAGDAVKLADPRQNLSAEFGAGLTSPPADRLVREGETLDLAGIVLEVRETPGHSSGHVVFVATELRPIIVLGGDVLFAGTIGRSDLPDSNPMALIQAICSKLFSLPDDTIVLPGHGPPTTIGRERQSNPYVGVAALERR